MKESWATELASISRHTKLSSWRDWILSLLTKGEIRHVQSCCFALSSYCLFDFLVATRISSPVQTDATLLANNSQHCWMLHIASVCSPCFMLLDVAACCCAKFETSQTCQPTTPNIFFFVPWSPKPTATMLDPFAQLFQHCWGHARSLRMDYKDLWVVFFPRCTAGPNPVGSCCIRLHTTANTHATTPNIVGATMSGVAAPVCTQP